MIGTKIIDKKGNKAILGLYDNEICTVKYQDDEVVMIYTWNEMDELFNMGLRDGELGYID